MSDQELDELFKNASEKYDAPYDPNDWEKLAARLNKETDRSGFWNWKTYLGLSTLLIVGTGSFIMFNTNDNETTNGFVKKPVKDSMVAAYTGVKDGKNVKAIVPLPLTLSEETQKAKSKNIPSTENHDGGNISNKKSLSKKETVTTDVKQSNKIDGAEQKNRDLISERKQSEQLSSDDEANHFSDKKTKPITSNKNQSIEESFSKKEMATADVKQSNKIDFAEQKNRDLISERKQSEQLPTDDEANRFSNEKTKAVTSNENHKTEESLSNKETVLADYKKSEDVSLKRENENLVNENNSQPSSRETNLFLANNQITDSLSETKKTDSVKSVADSVITSDTAKVVTTDEEKKKERVHHISLKLNVSPDYSSVGYYSPDKSGFNFGLIGEYSFTSHWSVSSGAIWTKKNYSGNDITYPYKGKMITANHFDGNCRMLDWPINVNYYFTPTNRLGVYVSAGLSSYFMFNQNYNYEVNYGGSEYYRSEEIKQKQNEWFKMSNLSFGLQYKLNQRWALQVEPFAKIPLAGVGQGNLKLVSSGVFFNIKYTFK